MSLMYMTVPDAFLRQIGLLEDNHHVVAPNVRPGSTPSSKHMKKLVPLLLRLAMSTLTCNVLVDHSRKGGAGMLLLASTLC